MPVFQVVHRDKLRSFILFVPPDWAEHWGDLHLVMGLHGDDQTAEAFAVEMEIEALIAGTLSLTVPAPQKVVAIFPHGLSLSDELTGSWDGGVMGDPTLEPVAYDVEFLAVCIMETTSLLQNEAARMLAAAPVGSPFENGRFMIAGKGPGGQLAHRYQAEAPSLGTVYLPHTVAVAGTSAGGMLYYSAPGVAAGPAVPFTVSYPPLGATPSNVIHFHSELDDEVLSSGGVSPQDRRSLSRVMGGPVAANGFFRFDLQPGPDDPFDFLPAFGGTALESWFVAAGPALALVYVPYDVNVPDRPFAQWTWETPFVPGLALSYVLSMAWRDGSGNVWPNEGFSATAIAFQFMLDRP